MRRYSILLLTLGMLLVVSGCMSSLSSKEKVPIDPAIFADDFESIPDGVSEAVALQRTPFGWVASGTAENWSLRLSDKMSYEGKYSMEIVVDPGATSGIHISSKPIPVEEGKEYTASLMLFNVTDEPYNRRTDLYLEFWPEGGWWGETDFWSPENWNDQRQGEWANKNRISHTATSGTMGEWSEVSTTAIAPAGAKYATVSFWTSSRVLKSYIDNVKFEVK